MYILMILIKMWEVHVAPGQSTCGPLAFCNKGIISL